MIRQIYHGHCNLCHHKRILLSVYNKGTDCNFAADCIWCYFYAFFLSSGLFWYRVKDQIDITSYMSRLPQFVSSYYFYHRSRNKLVYSLFAIDIVWRYGRRMIDCLIRYNFNVDVWFWLERVLFKKIIIIKLLVL